MSAITWFVDSLLNSQMTVMTLQIIALLSTNMNNVNVTQTP